MEEIQIAASFTSVVVAAISRLLFGFLVGPSMRAAIGCLAFVSVGIDSARATEA